MRGLEKIIKVLKRLVELPSARVLLSHLSVFLPCRRTYFRALPVRAALHAGYLKAKCPLRNVPIVKPSSDYADLAG